MRALELGRPLARATNDGVTALVDAQGRISARLPRFEPGVLAGSLQPRVGATPFGVTGSAPVVVIALLLLLAAKLLPPWLARRGSAP
jgi:apolipoprotein N-acyltransferase